MSQPKLKFGLEKKNVLLISNQLHRGGAQKVIANLSINLTEEVNVTMVIYNDIEKVDYAYGGDLVKIKLPFSQKTDDNNFLGRAIRFFYLIFFLRKIKKERKIDVSISFMEASNFVNILSRRKRERIILSVRIYLSLELAQVKKIWIYRVFISLLYNKADSIVVPSSMIKCDLCDKFDITNERVHVIPNFIDSDKIFSLQQEPILHPQITRVFLDNKVLVNVGRLDSQKGQDYLFPILTELKTKITNIKLLLVGGGPLQKVLEDRAKECGLKVCTIDQLGATKDFTNEADVYFLGNQKNPFQYLHKRGIFLFPSIYEGFPNALLESMACGLPVLSTDCFSGPRELLAPNTDLHSKAKDIEFGEYGILLPDMPGVFDGKLASPRNIRIVQLWSSAILQILEDVDLGNRYGIKAQKRSFDFAKGRILPQWLAMINGTH